MLTDTGNNLPNNSHNWYTKLQTGLALNNNSRTGLVVGLMAQLQQPGHRPGTGKEARAWQNTTASVVSRFEALRQLGLGSRYMGPGPRLDYHYDFFVVRESIEIFRGLRAQWSDGGQL